MPVYILNRPRIISLATSVACCDMDRQEGASIVGAYYGWTDRDTESVSLISLTCVTLYCVIRQSELRCECYTTGFGTVRSHQCVA